MILKGKSVNYKLLTTNDADSFYSWASNRDVVRYSLSWFSIPKSRQDFENWLGSINDFPESHILGFCCKHSGKLIGYTGIVDLSSMNRSGEYFILIGEKNRWGKGLGTEVTQTVIDYGFNTLDLHRIFLTVSEPNKGAVKAYRRAGFIQEGILRDAAFRDGKFHNKIFMSILSSDWKKSYGIVQE